MGGHSGPVSNKVHILLVDDESDLSKHFIASLGQSPQSLCFAIESVRSVRDCLQRLSNCDCDHDETVVVIPDLNTPEMDGLGLLTVLQNKFPRVRVYICTTYQTPFHRKTARGKGCLRFFSKPLTLAAFCGAIAEDFLRAVS